MFQSIGGYCARSSCYEFVCVRGVLLLCISVQWSVVITTNVNVCLLVGMFPSACACVWKCSNVDLCASVYDCVCAGMSIHLCV